MCTFNEQVAAVLPFASIWVVKKDLIFTSKNAQQYTLLFYKRLVYKKVKAEIGQNLKTYPGRGWKAIWKIGKSSL